MKTEAQGIPDVEGPIDVALSARCQKFQELVQLGNGLSNQRARLMWDHFLNLYRYSDYLGLLVADWRTISPACGDNHDKFFARAPKAPGQSLSDQEWAEFRQLQLMSLRLGLVTESFIIFAKVFLDRLADAILWFTASRQRGRGSSHSYLFGRARRFLAICKAHAFKSSEAVAQLGERLLLKVVEDRNVRIEHTSGSGAWVDP